MSDVVSVGANSATTADGWTVQSNEASGEEIQKDLESVAEKKETKKEEPDASTAAAVLGKKGGEAAAAARKIKPIPLRKEAKPAGDVDTPRGDAALDGNSAAGTEPGGDEPTQAGPDEKPLGKPRDDPRARMLEATRKEAEAKRQAAEYQRQLAERDAELARYRQGQPPQQQQPQEQPWQYAKPPFKPEEFAEYEDFIAASMAWNRQQWLEEMQHQQAVDAAAQELDNHIISWQDRTKSALPTLEDFEAKVAEPVRMLMPTQAALVQGLPVGPLNTVADEIMSSEQAPALMLHLSEHPDVLQRLATLPSVQAVQREMARLEAKVEAASAGTSVPTPAPISKAKPPVRPVTSSPPVDTDEISDDMPYDEFVRVMNARERRARR